MTRTRSRLLAATLSGLLLLAACGGSDDSSDSASGGTDESTTTTAAETTSTAAAPAQDPAEVEAEVSAAIEGFFLALGEGRFDDAATFLENGDAHLDEFQGFADLAVGVTAEATSVEVVDDTTAIYVIDISIAGAVALPDSSGEAAFVDGKWLMSEGSWNALAALAPAE